MYIVKDYLTNETVAITTKREDAIAMIRTELDGRKLIVEKEPKR